MPDTLYPPSNIRERIIGISRCVPVLNGDIRPYVNLDNAASTPVLQDVMHTITAFVDWYSSVHRGAGFKSRIATEAYDDAHRIACEFVGASPSEHVAIFGKNTTEAINKLSYRLSLRQDDVVLVSMLEHHSNDLPWRAHAQVHHIAADQQGRLDEDDLERLLWRYKGRVKLVAVTGASNVTGYMPDIHHIAEKAHEAGAQILIDCAQLAAHRTIMMRPLDDPAHLDYIALSAHKMYAPFGTGVLIGRRDTFSQGVPEYQGGGEIELVTADEVLWSEPPFRDEAGSPNLVGAIALASAAKTLKAIGMDVIAQYEAKLTTYALERLATIPGIRLYGDNTPQSAARVGMISFTLEGVPHQLTAAILATEWGIGVRAGCFCAQPYIIHLLHIPDAQLAQLRTDILAQDRREMFGLVRISFGMYNTAQEVDEAMKALSLVSRGEYHGHYEQDLCTCGYQAVGWDPDLHPYFKL